MRWFFDTINHHLLLVPACGDLKKTNLSDSCSMTLVSQFENTYAARLFNLSQFARRPLRLLSVNHTTLTPFP